MSTVSNQKQMSIVWGLVLILLGGFFLAEQTGLVNDLAAWVWVSVFALASLLFFITYWINGVTQWGWLFPATILAGLAAIIWLGDRGYDGAYLGSLIIGCVSLPFWVAFLVNRKENWWALIPGWITAVVAAIILFAEIIPGEMLASLILFSVALPFFVVYARNREHWWALIPGGIVASVGLMLFFLAPTTRTRLGDEVFVGVMFAGISLTFLLIWAQRARASTGWAIVPAVLFAALAGLVLFQIYYVGPLALIILGGWLLLGQGMRRPKLKG
jgi:hypothetical protein